VSTQTLQLPLILPSGPDCERCIARLQAEVTRIKGVTAAAVNNARTTITVTFDPDAVTLSRIESEARRVGADLGARIDHQTIDLADVDCPDCAASIEKDVERMDGVLWAGANFAAGCIHVEYERGRTSLEAICRVIRRHGVRACPLAASATGERQNGPRRESFWSSYRRLFSVLASAGLAVAGWGASLLGHSVASEVLYAGAIVSGGAGMARSALLALRARAVDMNVLMTVAIAGAAGIGEWTEGATVVVLYNIGVLLQAGAVERTRRSIRSLMDLRPRTARVSRPEGECEVLVEAVAPGDIVVVRPGERIPVDGVVASGSSAVNQAPITGESLPARKSPGDHVFAGTLNGAGALTVQVTAVVQDTVLARIIHRVEEAQAQRAPVQQFIDQFARVYTPIVVGLAAAIALLPPLGLMAWHALHGASMVPGMWPFWIERGLALLIVACPCALVISTPVAIVTAIGAASRNGALVKGGVFLEQIGRLRVMLYDKTGTLTEGRFRVEDVVPLGDAGAAEVLALAAAVEARSEHPLASAFVEAASRRGRPLPEARDFQSIPGRGARAVVEGVPCLVGSVALMESQGLDLTDARPHLQRAEALGKTAILVAAGGRVAGMVVAADSPRQGVAAVVADLESLGIACQALLTGDNVHAARSAAEAAGIREFKAGLLPEQKLELVREYRRRFGPVGMVGDGINDAPALAAADVGFVMGAVGSDTALETADVALMADDLTRLPFLIRLSRRTHAVIRQNVAFSLGTKAALLVAAVVVGIPLWLAVAGDVGVSLLVTLNALRLRQTAVPSLPARGRPTLDPAAAASD